MNNSRTNINTSKTATLNTRHYNRNNNRVNNNYSSSTLSRLPRTSLPKYDYSSSSATLGRVPRNQRQHQTRIGRNNSHDDVLAAHLSHEDILAAHLSESELYPQPRQTRKVKRTESFV